MAQTLDNLLQTWNNVATTFTGIKYNVTDTASAAGSLLMDLQVGGASQFSVSKAGVITIPGAGRLATGTVVSPSLSVQSFIGNANIWNTSRLRLNDTVTLEWANANNSGTSDVILLREGAGTLAQRRTTTAGPVTYPQTFRIYNEYTDTLNYERGKIEWASNVLRIGTEKLGSGTARALEFQTDGTTRLTIAANGTTTLASTTVFSSNMAFGTTTGTKIGTATNQKIGFWNVTPIEQPTTGIAEAAFVANAGGTTVTDDSTFDGYTIQQVVKALRDTGLLA